MDSAAPPLPVVIHRRTLALPYAVAAVAMAVPGVDMIRTGWLVGWRILGAALVTIALASGAAAIFRLGAHVAIGDEALCVRNWRRTHRLAWSDIRAVGLQLTYPGRYSVVVRPSGTAPFAANLRVRALDGFNKHRQFRRALATAGHGALDQTAADRDRFALTGPEAEAVTASQLMRHFPRALVSRAVAPVFVTVLIGMVATLLVVNRLTSWNVGFGIIAAPVGVIIGPLVRDDLVRRRRGATESRRNT